MKNAKRSFARMEFLEGRQLMASVATSLALYDMTGTTGAPIAPSSPGVWNIPAGTTFRVVVSASVASPNLTSAARTDPALRGKPLGLENLTMRILSSGVNIANPVATATTPSKWTGFKDLTPDHLDFTFANVLDVDHDGDLDPAGAGMFSLNFDLDSVTALPQFQYGAVGSPSATAGPMKLLLGNYTAVSAGTTKLATTVTTANVYVDSKGDESVTVQDVMSNVTNGSITINVTGGSPAGSIAGRVFNDKNSNGVFDSATEAGIVNAKVFIDNNKNGVLDAGEVSKLSSATGTYSFTGLTAGSYRVRQVPIAANRITTAAFYDVALAAGQNVINKNFGDTTNVLIKGTVFNDANSDGIKQSAEAGLANWKVFIDKNKNGVLDAGEVSTLTNSAGAYTFSTLPAGTYQVRAVLQSGFKRTTPSTGLQTVTLASGATVSNKNFGVKHL